MPSYSHSRISTFETCPLQYKYRYIDRVKVDVENTVEAYLGSQVHKSLEVLYRHIQFAKIISLEELLEDFNKRWEGEWSGGIKIVRGEYSAENYRLMGERYLGDYYKRHHPFDQGRILGLETQDFLSLDDEGRTKYHVRIDRLMDMGDGLYEVNDYKTNMKLPSQEELDGDRQLAMYSLWVRRRFKDFKRVRLVWHFLAFDKELDSHRSADELEALRLDVLSKIRNIETEQAFSPVESVLCDWCLYRAICPLWKHEAAVAALPENEFLGEEGVKLVDEYAGAKEALELFQSESGERLERLKEAILDFCQREGVTSIVGSRHRVTVKEMEQTVFPSKNSPERRQLEDMLRQSGRLEEVSGLDVSALSRILQDEATSWGEDLLEEIRKFARRKRDSRLFLRKRQR
jgi:putative RecB family exonuclease